VVVWFDDVSENVMSPSSQGTIKVPRPMASIFMGKISASWRRNVRLSVHMFHVRNNSAHLREMLYWQLRWYVCPHVISETTEPVWMKLYVGRSALNVIL